MSRNRRWSKATGGSVTELGENGRRYLSNRRKRMPIGGTLVKGTAKTIYADGGVVVSPKDIQEAAPNLSEKKVAQLLIDLASNAQRSFDVDGIPISVDPESDFTPGKPVEIMIGDKAVTGYAGSQRPTGPIADVVGSAPRKTQTMKAGGSIKIKPENRGKFTRWAKRRGMSVKEAANKVMANKEQYSKNEVQMANFAKNFAEDGIDLGTDPKRSPLTALENVFNRGMDAMMENKELKDTVDVLKRMVENARYKPTTIEPKAPQPAINSPNVPATLSKTMGMGGSFHKRPVNIAAYLGYGGKMKAQDGLGLPLQSIPPQLPGVTDPGLPTTLPMMDIPEGGGKWRTDAGDFIRNIGNKVTSPEFGSTLANISALVGGFQNIQDAKRLESDITPTLSTSRSTPFRSVRNEMMNRAEGQFNTFSKRPDVTGADLNAMMAKVLGADTDIALKEAQAENQFNLAQDQQERRQDMFNRATVNSTMAQNMQRRNQRRGLTQAARQSAIQNVLNQVQAGRMERGVNKANFLKFLGQADTGVIERAAKSLGLTVDQFMERISNPDLDLNT